MRISKKYLFNRSTVEKVLFLLIALFHLIPIISYQFFPTLDGPAHLYNSNLINELWLNPNSDVSQYFQLNSTLITNFFGHYFLSFLNLFLPAFIAEKVFLIGYALGVPYSMRYLIKQVNPQGVAVSYFSFPIIYSTVFLLGFYNFSIALVFFFLALGYWLKNQESITEVKNLFILGSLILLTLFSHLFVFAILLLCLILSLVSESIPNGMNSSSFKINWSKIKELAIVTFVPFLLFIYYFLSRPSSSKEAYLTIDELTNNLINMDFLIGFNSMIEGPHVIFVLLSICILIVAKISIHIYRVIQIKQFSSWVVKSDFWLVTSFMLLGLYYYLPNSNGFGGFISNRISLLFFVLLIIWIATEKIPKLILIPCIALMLFSSTKLIGYYNKTMYDLTKLATNCFDASEYIEEGSVVLPLNFSGEWNTGHYSNFLGIEKPVVILDNYEAVNDYFPVSWRPNSFPKPWGEPIANNSFNCLDLKNEMWEGLQIDYIFVIKNSQKNRVNCDERYNEIIKELYSLAHENDRCLLYQLNKSR